METLQALLLWDRKRFDDWAIVNARRVVNGQVSVDFVAKGSLPVCQKDLVLNLTGEWKTSPGYGPEFQVSYYSEILPSSALGISKYLSLHIRGIGEKKAAALLQQFGSDLRGVVAENPNRLLEVKGITGAMVEEISEIWSNNDSERQLGIFLAEHEIGGSWAKKILKKFGVDAPKVLSENPYDLMQVGGIGFLKADEFAKKLGWPAQSRQRTRAAFTYVMEVALEEGNSFLHKQDLIEKVIKMTSSSKEEAAELYADLLEKQELVEEHVDRQDGIPVWMTYLPDMHQAEVEVPVLMTRLLSWKARLPKNFQAELIEVQKLDNLELSGRQLEAVKLAFTSPVSILTGPPGTGKTQTLNTIVKVATNLNMAVEMAAPTGRAAKRMEELTGQDAKTLHRLLEYNPRFNAFQRNEDNPLEAQMFFIDEGSMVDLELFAAALRAIPRGCHLVIIGDEDQLPSVGAGTVLRDLIRSHCVPVTVLDQIFRQAAGSDIIQSAHAIRAGKMPPLSQDRATGKDAFLVEAPRDGKSEDAAWVTASIVKMVSESIPRKMGIDAIGNIQVLAPQKAGPCGVAELNKSLQAALNPDGDVVQIGPRQFRLGDPMMQMRNNYKLDVFNGDRGVVEGYDPDDKVLKINFDGEMVHYPYDSVGELALCYASTIHKAQGSQSKVIVLVILLRHQYMLDRNLIYTGISRAQELLVVVGSRQAVKRAVDNVRIKDRNSFLTERLCLAFPGEIAA